VRLPHVRRLLGTGTGSARGIMEGLAARPLAARRLLGTGTGSAFGIMEALAVRLPDVTSQHGDQPASAGSTEAPEDAIATSQRTPDGMIGQRLRSCKPAREGPSQVSVPPAPLAPNSLLNLALGAWVL
jgi:hypothetical protein